MHFLFAFTEKHDSVHLQKKKLISVNLQKNMISVHVQHNQLHYFQITKCKTIVCLECHEILVCFSKEAKQCCGVMMFDCTHYLVRMH